MREPELQIALRHHQAGQLVEAEAHYRRIVAQQPDHPDALHLLGVIALQVGRHQSAVELIRRAITVRSDDPRFHSHLGEAYRRLGRLDDAVTACRRATALRSHDASAQNNLGMVLGQQGKLDEAIEAYSAAIRIAPNLPEPYYNMAPVLIAQGKLAQAMEACRKAIQLKSDCAEAYGNLGIAFRKLGKFEEAVAAYRKAIELRPGTAEFHVNLANAFNALGKHDKAIAACTRAVEISPESPEVRYGLGDVLKAQGKLDEAATAYSRAIELKSDYFAAYLSLGNVLNDQGKFDLALGACRKAIELKPASAEAHFNLANTLRDREDPDAAAAEYRTSLALKPDYAEAHVNLASVLRNQGLADEALGHFDRSIALRPDDAGFHSNRIYAIHFHPHYDAAAILREHLAWNHLHARPLQAKALPHDNDRSPERRLRIGYVAPDFREHCQSLFTVPLLSHHDHEGFEIFCYSGVVSPDAVTEQLRAFADGWRSTVGISDDGVADMIRRDQIDILVDLTLHMSHNRLLVFARKPAPVQVTWLGYPATTGLGAMDCRFSDPYLDPPEQDEFYAEQTVRLAQTFWCYDPLTSEPAVNDLPALGNGWITFGCLNNFCKVNENVLDLWAQVLTAVPNSRLMLLAAEGSHRQRTRDSLARRQVDPQRIEFAGHRPRREYLEHYHRIDIGLDTFPYNGHTTSLDSYWMGVPVVTLAGWTAVGRAGVSQLSNLGLTELIARTAEQYVQIAATLAQDKPALAKLRGELRTRMQNSALMDGGRFAASIEAAYRQMWRRWCGGSS